PPRAVARPVLVGEGRGGGVAPPPHLRSVRSAARRADRRSLRRPELRRRDRALPARRALVLPGAPPLPGPRPVDEWARRRARRPPGVPRGPTTARPSRSPRRV